MVVKVGCLGPGPAFDTDGVVEVQGVICWISRDPHLVILVGQGVTLYLSTGVNLYLTPSEGEEKRTLYSIPLDTDTIVGKEVFR